MCKQILGVKKFTNNIKVLSGLGRRTPKINIETKMFKYFQRFPSTETSVINGTIPKEEYKSKHKYFKKRVTNLYLHFFTILLITTKTKGSLHI